MPLDETNFAAFKVQDLIAAKAVIGQLYCNDIINTADIKVQNDLSISGDLFVAACSRTRKLKIYSDQRLKENIKHTSMRAKRASLERILLLDTSSFRFKGDEDKNYGFIAQNVQSCFPDCVATDENDMLLVDTTSLLAKIIDSIQAIEHDRRQSCCERFMKTFF